MTTHGTPAGYDAGCHGAGECVNHRTGLMTCTEARTRYRGEYAYRRAVDAGTATAEREQFAKPVKVAKAAKVATVAKDRRAPASARPKGVRGAPQTTVKRASVAFKHGTPWGFKKCNTDCPNEALGLVTCTQAHRDYQNAYAKMRREGGGPAIKKHGTHYGYTVGCRDIEKCPMPAGESCWDAHREQGRKADAIRRGRAAA